MDIPAVWATRSAAAVLTADTSRAEAPKPSVHQSGHAPLMTGNSFPWSASISSKNCVAVAVCSFGQLYFSFHCLIISQASVDGGALSVRYPECWMEISSQGYPLASSDER